MIKVELTLGLEIMKNSKHMWLSYLFMHNMRYVLNIKYTQIICLEPSRGIDRYDYREDTVAAAYTLKILRPRLGR